MKANHRFQHLLCGLAAALSCSLAATGCFLLPSEEVSHDITIETEATYDFDLAEAVIGDVISSKTVYCTYSETVQVDLSFSTGGMTVRYVYVSEGDHVKAGDLLAQLDTDSLDSQYEDYEYTIRKTELLLEQTAELMAYDLAELAKSYEAGELSAAEYANEQQSVTNRYQSTIDNYNETLYIDRLRMEQIEEKLSGAYIYAPMDGSVSYVYSGLAGTRATAGSTVISLVDAAECAFAMEDSSYASYFTEGEALTLQDSKGNTYETTVAVKTMDNGSEQTFFVLTDTDLTVTVGTRAYYTLVLDEADGVLMVPYLTVHQANGQYFVYCQNENGFKTLQYVTIGLKGNDYIEIVDGLNEGDYVIRK